MTESFIQTNQQMKELAKALDNEVAPDGNLAAGLAIMLSDNASDEIVHFVFLKEFFPKSFDIWDALKDVAKNLKK